MATPLDIITRAMKDIGALAGGEVPTADEAQDGLDMLNDLLEQWSNESMMVFYRTELVFNTIQNTVQYTLGPGGSVGATFTGSITGNLLTVTSITSGAITQGMTISGSGITAGTKIVAFETGAGGNVNEAGTYTLSKFQAAPVSSETINAYYERPLTIESAFVRVATMQGGSSVAGGYLDYPVAVLSLEEYEGIGIKQLNGPWAKAIYYMPAELLGTVYCYPNPAQGELHLFTQTIFRNFGNLTDNIEFPQGYNMALRWCLAERLMPMYGKTGQAQIAMITAYAGQAKATLKRINMQPPKVARYPDSLMMGKAKDAGFIMDGGFR